MKKRGKEFSVWVPFKIRMAMQVAMALAEELNPHFRPVLMGVNEAVVEAERPRIERTTLRFEGGTVIKVDMVNLNGGHPEEWVVVSAELEYHPECSTSNEKTFECWGPEELLELKVRRPWWHPDVKDANDIEGVVAIFFDHASREGSIKVDPEYDHSGNEILQEAIPYRRFVGGDLERAKEEAQKKLAEY